MQHGWTEGCPKCKCMLLHPSKEGGPVHSDHCKSRILQALRATPAGRTRIEHAERRQTESIAQRCRRGTPLESDVNKDLKDNTREERLDHRDGDGPEMFHEDGDREDEKAQRG